MVAVSAATGAGLDELRAELAKLAATVPEKDASQYFRLPIDRAFAMRGFGTVVTGTLVSGVLRVDQEVELHPARKRVRVRGIQVHGADVKEATAGQRTALNIAGVDASELARGMALAEAGRFHVTRHIDCVFELLPSAKPLKHRAPVHFHAGTAEVEAEIRRLKGTDPIAPGSREYVRLVLSEPLLHSARRSLHRPHVLARHHYWRRSGAGYRAAPAPERRPSVCESSKPRHCRSASRCWPANRVMASECLNWLRAPVCSKPTFEKLRPRRTLTRAGIAAILAARSRMGGGQVGSNARAFEAVPSAESPAGWSL